MTTPAERAHYLNFVGVAWALGTLLGPIVGGAFADSAATWRWAFYINLVAAAVCVPVCAFFVPPILPPAASSYSPQQRIKRVDYLGEALWLAGISTVVAILASGGTIYEWTSPSLIGLYVAAAVSWILFSIQQRLSLFTVDRIFPVELFGDLDMVRLFCWSAIAIANDTVTIYSLPLLYQFAFNDDSLHAALWILPFIGALLVGGLPLGPLFPKFSMYKVWFLGAGALMLVAGGLSSTINLSTSRGAISGYIVLQGLGCGPIVQLPFTIGQAKIRRSESGKATAFFSCAQMAGLVLSLGIASTVFLNDATEEIAPILPNLPRNVIQAAINGVGSSLFDTLSADDRDKVLRAIARSVGKLFYLNVAGSALGFILALSMKQERLQLKNDEP
ncbi:major facilitator superfamily domain-containing protein [Xylaria intraflava]|nr:major facilitator superfamily domain-containing protein [Xylaria intraflava]